METCRTAARNATRAKARAEQSAPPAIFPLRSLTPDQIVGEARRLPREQSAELFDRLLADTVALIRSLRPIRSLRRRGKSRRAAGR